MRLVDTINTYIELFLQEHELYSTFGTVTDITESSCTIQIENRAKMYDVILYLKDMQIIPKKGSKCIITFLSPTDAYISHIEEVNKISITAENIVFNGGNNEGLVLINGLVKKLNSLENELNKLKSVLAAWTPVPLDGGLVLKGLVTPWATDILSPTIKEEIENKKIKQ